MLKTKYYILNGLFLLLGFVVLIFGIRYRLPVTSNLITSFEALLFKYFIIVFGLVLVLVFGLCVLFRRRVRRFFRLHKDFLKNILLLLGTIVLFLIILEIVLFLTEGPTERTTISDLKLHHVNIPDSDLRFKTEEFDVMNKINSIGLRDKEILEKNNKRILMLGDSFTFGYGVELEYTFTKQLEKKLDSIDVINAGVISYSPVLEYVYLREKGLELKPDFVVLNFDMSDVIDDYKYNKSAIYENGEIVSFDVSKKERRLVNIFMKIRTIKFFKLRFERLLKVLFEKNIINKNNYDINNDRYIILRENLDTDPYWTLTLDYIKKINDLCEKNNIKFILHVYPYAVQVDGEEWGEGRSKWGFEKGKVYTTKPFSVLGDFSRENDIMFISGLSEFKQSIDKPLFFSYDGHFNEKGHLLIAEYIYENLINEDLI